MKGVMLIVMLLALLVTSYLVIQDLKAKQEQGTSNIKAIEKARQVGDRVHEAQEAQEERLRNIVGE